METKIKTIKNTGLIIKTIKEILTDCPQIKNYYGYISVLIEIEIYEKLNIYITDYYYDENKTVSIKTYNYLYCFCLA